MYITNTAGCGSGGTWESYATSKAWTLGQTNATATVYVKYRNASLTESSCINDTITHDDLAPSSTSISIAGGSSHINTTSVTLTLAATGASEMYITNTATCSGGGTWGSYSTTKDWSLGQTNATATVYVKFRDLAGNESACTSDTITHDDTAPTSTSISIAAAATYTTTTSITLALAATGASEMYITNTAACSSGGSWESYSTSKAWTLGQTNATATVYVKFRDQALNESSCINDTIIHDDTAPTISSITMPINKNYVSTNTLDFTVNFSESVTITNTPRIAITVGVITAYANYLSGSGSAQIVFRYTVGTTISGHVDPNGIALVSPLQLNGGTIRDAATNNATLTFTPPSNGITINNPIGRLEWQLAAVTQYSYDFGTPGVVTTVSFTIKNSTGSTVNSLASSIVFTSPTSSSDTDFFSYVSDNCNGQNLTNGSSCSIQIRFDPTVAGASGQKSVSVQVMATSPAPNPLTAAQMFVTGTK
jgi:hypothetical protein